MVPAHRKAVLAEVKQRLLDKKALSGGVHLHSSRRGWTWTSRRYTGRRPGWTPSSRPPAGATGRSARLCRCNREGTMVPGGEHRHHLPGGRTGRRNCSPPPSGLGMLVLDRFADIASREAVHAYFSTLLELNGPAAQDERGILPLMEKEFFPFRTVAERFHLIDDRSTVTVYVPPGRGCGADRPPAGRGMQPEPVPPAGAVRRVRLSGSLARAGPGRRSGTAGRRGPMC